MHRDILPSVSWLREQRFSECAGEEVMGFFEATVRWLERMAAEKEGEALCLAGLAAAEGGHDGGGDGVEIDVDGDGEARIQCRRLRSFFGGVRALCAERGISCGADTLGARREHGHTAAASVVSPPFGVRASEEVVAAVSAAAAARAPEAGGRTSPSDGGGGGGGDDHRWDGWLVFSAAVILASSEDRPFLCRCALQSLWGGAGLPRTQMIELLSKTYVALRPAVVEAKTEAAATGFQAASGVAAADTWDGTGSYRLRNDLLQCIYALESYFVRWAGKCCWLLLAVCRLDRREVRFLTKRWWFPRKLLFWPHAVDGGSSTLYVN